MKNLRFSLSLLVLIIFNISAKSQNTKIKWSKDWIDCKGNYDVLDFHLLNLKDEGAFLSITDRNLATDMVPAFCMFLNKDLNVSSSKSFEIPRQTEFFNNNAGEVFYID
ncbi:MAG: hypothetical protein Q8K02_16225, partial [Flavobacterium sp.]|nr:hypothetical protein [Flavobacterium sp.]